MHIFKRHNLGLIFVLAALLLVVAVVSCRGETPVSPGLPTSSPASTISRPTLQPTPSPIKTIKTPTTLPSETSCPSYGSIEEQAQEALADWLGISAKEIEVIKVEEVEWPDTSLGCPEPGKVYTQVITPGCRITLEAGGETYEVHTGDQQMVVCDEEGNPLVRGGLCLSVGS